MNKHVRKYFVEWHSGRLSEKQKALIESHLENCNACNMFFSKMENTLKIPSQQLLEVLPADPYLARRIIARAEQEKWPARRFNPALRYAVGTVLVFTAVSIGFTLGQNLAKQNQDESGNQLISEFYESYQQESFEDYLSDYLSVNTEVQNEK